MNEITTIMLQSTQVGCTTNNRSSSSLHNNNYLKRSFPISSCHSCKDILELLQIFTFFISFFYMRLQNEDYQGFKFLFSSFMSHTPSFCIPRKKMKLIEHTSNLNLFILFVSIIPVDHTALAYPDMISGYDLFYIWWKKMKIAYRTFIPNLFIFIASIMSYKRYWLTYYLNTTLNQLDSSKDFI